MQDSGELKLRGPAQRALPGLVRQLTGDTAESRLLGGLARQTANAEAGKAVVVGGRTTGGDRYHVTLEWMPAGNRHIRVFYWLSRVHKDSSFVSCYVQKMPPESTSVHTSRQFRLANALTRLAAKRLGVPTGHIKSVVRLGKLLHCRLNDGRIGLVTWRSAVTFPDAAPAPYGVELLASKLLWAAFGSELVQCLPYGQIPDFIIERLLEQKI